MNNISNSLPEGAALIPVLKCDAYGLGLEKVAKAVCGTGRIKTLSVAQVSEACRLRELGVSEELLVVGPAATPAQILAAAEGNIILTAHRPGFISEAASLLRPRGLTLRVHLKINTGLNRLGFGPGEELAAAIRELRACGGAVRPEGVFTHFKELVGDTDEAGEQFELYKAALSQLEAAGIDCGMRHICASAGYEYHPEMALDAVRLGRRLYYDNRDALPGGMIKEPASWRAVITDVRLRRAGERLGYGKGHKLEADTRVALVGVGYGDGLFRGLVEAHAPVLVGGERARLLCCCMDQCFIDVGDIPCSPCDEATFFGYDALGNLLPGQQVAALIDDEACSLTAALGARVKRVYV